MPDHRHRSSCCLRPSGCCRRRAHCQRGQEQGKRREIKVGDDCGKPRIGLDGIVRGANGKFSSLFRWKCVRKLAVALMLAAVMAQAQPSLHLKAKHLRPEPPAPAVAQNTRTPGQSHWLVQFQKPPGIAQLGELGRRGARVLSYVPDYGLSVVAADNTHWDGLDAGWVGQLRPDEKISPALAGSIAPSVNSAVVVEFYTDVDPNQARTIANQTGVVIQENPDLLAHHLLVWGDAAQVLTLAGWDEVAYIFPASAE